MCCKILEIEYFKKPAGRLCVHCEPGKGCGIYHERPTVCREYECLWLTERELSVNLKPEKVGALLMEDPDSDQYQVVCDPARPMAWRHPLMFKHLISKAKEGRVVVAKAGLTAWRIFESGEWGPWV